MISLRAKKIKNCYSLFLDYNRTKATTDKNGKVVHKREMEFLSLYTQHDYSKRKRIEPTDKETYQTALAILKKRELALLIDDRELVPQYSQADFMEFFKNQLPIKNHRTYDATYKHLSTYLNNKPLLFKKVDKSFIVGFMGHLQKIVKTNSVLHYINRMRIIWNVAMRKDIIRHNPFLDLDKPKKTTPERTFLTIEELQKIKDAPTNIKQVIKDAFLFACFTGLRFSDIKTLDWAMIQNGAIHHRQQKTQKIEVLPLTKQATNILDTIHHKTGKVFKDLPVNDCVNDKLRTWCKDAEIEKDIHFHSARHTFAILSLFYDVDIYTVSKLLGHSKLETTQVYAKILDNKKREAVNKLPELI